MFRCQFLYAAQHCVRAWDTGLRTLRKSVSFSYRLRSSIQSSRQQKTEKTARIISLY